jgi:hypothetical protein
MKANYLTAVSSRIDSLWVPNHLNAMLPRAVTTPQNLGMARLVSKVDAYLEPCTILGHLATRNRLGRLRLGIGVTDADHVVGLADSFRGTIALRYRSHYLDGHPAADDAFLFVIACAATAFGLS